MPIILNPVRNLAKTQTYGSTKTTCIKELRDAIEAKAANTLMWPTLVTSFGTIVAPMKNPIKYPDIIVPVAIKLKFSITDLIPKRFPWNPCEIMIIPKPVKSAQEFFIILPITQAIMLSI